VKFWTGGGLSLKRLVLLDATKEGPHAEVWVYPEEEEYIEI